MNITALFHGGGRRRRSMENWDELERRLSDAEARTKHVKGAHRYECAQHLHGPFWVRSERPIPCPWCEIGRLRGQLELVTMRPAPRPDTVAVAAPVDQTIGVARPENEPATDVTAETQAVDVRELRDAVGLGATQTLPAVAPVTPVAPVDETQLLVTWGTKLPPNSGPTSVPVGLGERISVKVATDLDAMNEAS